jgi:hypothetical protein
MASFVPQSPETLADRALYTSEGLTPVACSGCAATVAVRKNSEQQTAIQWDAENQFLCPERAKHAGIHEGCPVLRASIEAAVRDGSLPIGVRE